MSEENTRGTITWTDLTVSNCQEVRDFYSAVVGWTSEPVPMGDYDDFCMNSPDGKTVAGICHAQGSNADLPPQWLIYINVDDLATSLLQCESLGGRVLHAPWEMGNGKCAVIQDPSGAVAALFETSGAD